MAKRTYNEKQVLGTILLGTSAFTGVMAIVFLIKFIFFPPEFTSIMMAVTTAWVMLFGAFLGLGMNYTIRVPRGREDDLNQMIMWLILIVLGTIVIAAMQTIISIGDYILISVAYYAQSWIMFLIGVYSLKNYRKKKI